VSHNYQNKEPYKRHSTKQNRPKILGAPERETEPISKKKSTQKIETKTNPRT